MSASRIRSAGARRRLLGLLFAALAPPVLAADFELDLAQLVELSPPPGSVVDQASASRYAHLLDADFQRFVTGGFATLAVGEPLAFTPHSAYVQATRRYRGQAVASEAILENYVQGLPFAGRLGVDDPQAGLKAAWNMRYAYTGDNGLLPEIHWQLRDWRRDEPQFEMLFEARAMRFMFRHVLPPVPFVEDNPQDAFAASFLRAVDAGSYDDTAALVFMNRDESREPNGWVYLPQLGRTQSLAAFATGESMFGSDILPSDFLVYSGPLTEMRWRFVGHTYMLLPLYRHDRIEPAARKARKHDYWHVAFDGRAGCFPRVAWQLRPTLVLEGTAVDPAAPVQKRVFYIDAQTHVAPFWKVYRENDALWKFVIAPYAHPNSHVVANHESGAPIPTAFSTIDIGTNRCTTVQLLALVNVAEVGASDFDTTRMQSGGGRGFRR
ncbi:MAG: DUF1329 domain-containing protein [Gammaproteobacteria bacterium]